MKANAKGHLGVQELCRKLKSQLDELAVKIEREEAPDQDKIRRGKLLKELQAQLTELSS